MKQSFQKTKEGEENKTNIAGVFDAINQMLNDCEKKQITTYLIKDGHINQEGLDCIFKSIKIAA